MADKMVFGTFASRHDADTFLDKIKQRNVDINEVSIIVKDKKMVNDLKSTSDVEASKGTGIGAGSGAVTGGIIGLLGAAALLPGVNLFAVGPLVSLLAGAGIGAVSGGIVGALVGLGISEQQARSFADKVEEGQILIAVPEDQLNGSELKDIFEKANATDKREISVNA
ncbi:MAG: hypothetical protein ACOCXT_00020 [Candidatus Dojkabacteria bacterium]